MALKIVSKTASILKLGLDTPRSPPGPHFGVILDPILDLPGASNGRTLTVRLGCVRWRPCWRPPGRYFAPFVSSVLPPSGLNCWSIRGVIFDASVASFAAFREALLFAASFAAFR